MGSFTKLGLRKEILDVLASLKFKESLAVQDAIIPVAMSGKSLVFTSRTGSGKTLAYLLGYINKINKKQGLQMLVIVPTRELCIQVGKEINSVCEPLDIKVGSLYGGRDTHGDYRTTNRRNQIIVGTPGRLIDHINAKTVRVGDVRCIVYDESDQMFDTGFLDDCVYLRQRVNINAQVILSSATITKKVEMFISEMMEEHELMHIGELIPKNIVQEKLYCDILEKEALIVKFFQKKKFNRAIVFCNTILRVCVITKALSEHFHAKMLTGSLDQNQRQNTLNLFKDGKIRILVTTDVAARGLQIEAVDIIVNYDAPTRYEFYVHRIGRTGRRDKPGYAMSLVCKEDEKRFEETEKKYDLYVAAVTKDFERIE